ncbi:uncharacterized protein LOC130686644 isoform X1 [Daphnia carinata]|uniref:uncharacterized protein LOC130686644 isoform X1 n=1 Tax=Daphnia carinata TaxID=120202 RepID=UPI00257EACD6|nr:uncharacterized protein LOC130686644 isoform X1 [Daphnia carinata]
MYPASSIFNLNPSYCAPPMADKYLPVEVMFGGGHWSYVFQDGCCWRPNEVSWTPYSISPVAVAPSFCMLDVLPPKTSMACYLSVPAAESAMTCFSSLPGGDSCSSLESSPTTSLSSKKLAFRIENSDDKIWRFPKTAPPPVPLPGWNPLPYGLERFWKNAFMWLFIELFENNHLWTLKPVEKPPDDDGKGTPWETVIHSAKVRFNCEQANHGWTSMQGRVVFWFRMLHGIESGFARGEVVFKLYGQKCERCTSGAFETPLWYPEEIANAMWNLYSKVAEKFYGRPLDKVVRGLRGGKPRTPHKPELCQSCSDGLPCGKF